MGNNNILEELFFQERNFRLEATKLLSKKCMHECLFDSCHDLAINSHVISRNLLEKISHDGRIISAKFDRNDLGNTYEEYFSNNKINVSFDKIGLKQASTFKGFCAKHDNDLFRHLDDCGITSIRDIYKQLYRIEQHTWFILMQIAKADLKIRGQEYYGCLLDYRNMPCSYEHIINILENIINDNDQELDNNFNIPVDKWLQIKPYENCPINIVYKILGLNIKTAIYKDLIIVRDNNLYHCIYCILPKDSNSEIIILYPHNFLQGACSWIVQDSLSILNCIESILMNDSQFFMSPEITAKWSDEKKRIIEEDFYFHSERRFLEEYDISIFDEERKRLCSSVPNEIKKHELSKIDNLPKRKTFEQRDQDYTNKRLKFSLKNFINK